MTPQRFEFAGFSFTPDTGELVAVGRRIRLEPQPARVLALLVERSGELVTREELRAALWADRAIAADQGINYCIRAIRAALGDDAQGSRFIETLPRRGYRFAAAVTVVAGDDTAAPTLAEDAGDTPVAVVASRGRGMERLARPAIAVLLVIAAAYAAWQLRAPPAAHYRIAVLPLRTSATDTVNDATNRQFTELLVERLTNDSTGRYDVLGPATTGRFTGVRPPEDQIGRELGVDLVLSGGVSPRDTMMFIQVIRVSDAAHVFAWRQRVAGDRMASAAADVVTKMRDRVP